MRNFNRPPILILRRNPKGIYSQKIKSEIAHRLDLNQSFLEISKAVDLPEKVVHNIANRLGFFESERKTRQLEKRYGEPEKWISMPYREKDYELSSFGRVAGKSLGEAGEIIPFKAAKIAGKDWSIAKLVAHAFLGPKPESYEVKHRDGDPSNNFWRNLIYKPSHVFSSEKRKEIERRLAAGEKYATIMADLKVRAGTLRRIAVRAKIPAREQAASSRILTKKEKEEIIKLAANGVPYKIISKKYRGISISRISLIAREASLPSRHILPDPKIRKEVEHRIKAGEAYPAISLATGFSVPSIKHIAKNLRKTGEIARRINAPLSKELRREIIKRVSQGERVKVVGKALGINWKRVWDIARKALGPLQKKLSKSDVEAIVFRTEQGEAISSIAEAFEVTSHHIRALLRKRGILLKSTKYI